MQLVSQPHEVQQLRIADIEFINAKNANTTGVGSELVADDTLVFFNLRNIKDDELEQILNYKSFVHTSWKEGKRTIYFVYKYGYGDNSKVIWCYSGFSPILIRLLQNKYGYTINGKELYRAKEITRLPNMLFSLWDFQKEAIEAWINNGCFGIIQAPTASGKCCKYNTLILTDNGFIKIGDIVNGISKLRYNRESLDYQLRDDDEKLNIEKVKVINVQDTDKSIEFKKFDILNKYDMGVNDTITIKTKIGIEICGTPDHKVVVIAKGGRTYFKMLKDITVEDNIAVTYNMNMFNQKELELNHIFTNMSKYAIYSNNVKNVKCMTKDLARLLGYAIAEGNVSGNSFIITTFDEEMQSDIIKLYKNIGLDAHDMYSDKNDRKSSGVITYSVNFIDFIRHIGYIDFSKNKEVPWSILQSNKECQIEFLKGLFDGDGTLGYESIETYEISEYKTTSTIEYSSSSYELCRQLQIMLLNIGIVSRLKEKKEATIEYKGELKTFEKSHRLSIYGGELLRYAKEIGFGLSRKKELLNEFVKKLEERERHDEIVYPNINGKLNILHEKLIEKGKNRELYINQKVRYPSGTILTERKYFSYTSYLKYYDFKQMWSYVSGKRSPCRETLEYILKVFEPLKDDHNWIFLNELKNKFIFVKVESVEKGKEKVYDMTIDEVHSYIGNCMINHNSLIGCSIMKKMNTRTIILCHTADLLVNVWFNYIVQQFGEEIKDRIGIIGGGLTNKDRKMMRIIENDFGLNIKKDIVIATSQSLLAGNKLTILGEEHFGLCVVDEIHHYSSEQFRRVAGAVRAAYRLGLSATLHRSDGLSPIFYALLGDVRYRIGIKELVKKGLLVEPIFYSIIIEDEEACGKILSCKYKLLEYSRYVKKVSGSSELKFRYILGLCQSLQSKGRKFMLYTDFVNKSGIDENGIYPAESVYTRDDYVKGLIELKLKVVGISSEMSGIQRQMIFDKLGKNELDGIVFGSLGSEGINIPAVEAIVLANATASTIRYPQRVGRAMRLYKNKKNCYIYEILLNVPKELKWSEDNFLEYEEQGFKKEKIYVNNDGYLIKKEIKTLN